MDRATSETKLLISDQTLLCAAAIRCHKLTETGFRAAATYVPRGWGLHG